MTRRTFEPIAVVGQSCVLPGALSPEELWTAVVEGRDLVSTVPEGRWGLARDLATTTSPEDSGDRTWSERGGYVRGFEEIFDPEGFRLPAEEVLALDPLFQWVLHTGRGALKSAGLEADRQRTGVVLGNLSFPAVLKNRFAEACWLDRQTEKNPFEVNAPDARNHFMSGLPAHLLAQALGLGGRAFALDDACASSLYAVKLACDQLHDRRADTMLAGAVACADDLFIHIGFCALEALSRSGQSRPFHRGADGLLPAEGAAFVVLKRLDDAVKDGDRILGVIRGVGLSNDGRGRGLLAPSEEGQERSLRQAYEQSGLKPADVSLVECHATGTPVGDATELLSLGRLYEGLRDVPIGSLKSNLGHLITTAGLAGLLKVLAALKAKTRPPTLHVDDPHPVLEGSPFRLLQTAEPWPSEGPRRAAISAFGFGGNNAHLLVEEWSPETSSSVGQALSRGAQPADRPEIAVVALSVIAADGKDVEDFADALFSGADGLKTRPDGSRAGQTRPIEVPLQGLRFPPRDLERTLPQQLLLLQAARQAVETLDGLPRERTGVFVGMGCDAEISRYGLRLRLADWARGEDEGWIHEARAAVAPVLESAGVLGTMPNILANRLNSQLDLGGASGTVSSEELSGVVALEIATRALGAGELDAVLVGAVDLSCEPVHEAAARELLPEGRQVPGDAAVVLVLKRLDDARRDGDRVLAVLGEDADGVSLRLDADGDGDVCNLTPRFGHAHAASGLLHVAAAVLACHQRARPRSDGAAVPWLDAAPRAEVKVAALGGQSARVQVAAADDAGSLGRAHPRLHLYSGQDRREVAARLRDGVSVDGAASGPARLVIVARDDEELAARRGEALRLLEAGRLQPGEPPVRGIHFRERGVEGDQAFVFTGAAAAYAGMGRELLLAFPELTDRLGRRVGRLDAAAWVYGDGDAEPSVLDQLWGSSLLCQAHAELSRRLGLRADATLGYSSGESNALMALGAWNDMEALCRDTVECGLFTEQLAGRFAALRRTWGTHGEWAGWVLGAPAEDVRAAVATEERVYLTIVSSPEDVVIGGEAAACRRLIERLDAPAHPLGYPMVAHCPVVETVAKEWLELHRRPTAPVPGVRFYTHADGGRWYEPTSERAAQAILGQAVATIDFPALVRKAWDDGVRVFVEHGPRGLCSRWITKTLRHHGVADDEYLAVAYDRGGSSLESTAEAVAALLAAGVEIRREAWNERPRLTRGAGEGPSVTFAAHWPEIELPPLRKASESLEGDVQWMAPAPELPSVLDDEILAPGLRLPLTPTPVSPPDPAWAPVLAEFTDLHTRLVATRQEYLDSQTASLQQFLAMQQKALDRLASFPALAGKPEGRLLKCSPGIYPRETAAKAVTEPAQLEPPAPSPPAELPGPKYSRQQLEVLASGRISSVFGPFFEPQDGYELQVRMPEPPFLLADRVTGIDAEPGSMQLGTIWTETDVREGSWYLHQGRMPGGLMIEAGQADLLLISWLGIDFLNRGERVYRLLGCELTYRGSLPKPGDTLCYDIHVDGHARQGDIRLFFFHYDCRVAGEARLEVRHGQAGFFTDEELADSEGVLWEADEASPRGDRLDAPRASCVHRSFTHEQLVDFSEGRVFECMGPGFELAATHTLTPRIQDGRMLLLGHVTDFDLGGGPWKRGYLRATTPIRPDDWVFDGHFKNDPCMPGTLMLEGCFQTMAIYLTAMGFTLERDGWRFEPVTDEPYPLRCRGQIVPGSRELVSELFVHEVIDGPYPTLYADLLGTVDGLKAFHAERVGLRLVPDWPLLVRPLPVEVTPVRNDEEVAVVDGFAFDYASLLACAWGRPSEAFGEMYRPFDGPRRAARLPGPPYHFMSRIAEVHGEIGKIVPGTWVEAEYDVPPDAWYFRENGARTMPYAVLLEVGLQPCGWLASFLGSALTTEEDLQFRNLDGTGTLHAEVLESSGTLRTRVELLSSSQSGGMIILRFRVEMRAGVELVYDMETAFGFFPHEAMANQVGLPVSDEARAALAEPSDFHVDLTKRPQRYCGGAPRLAGPRLLMLDRITGFWNDGGKAGLGRLRAEKDVDPAEWFFKAHFFQDPVQPGSLGIEAMVELLQFYMLDTGMGEGVFRPRFEPILSDRAMTWKYRGQVVPTNRKVTIELEIGEVGRDERGPFAVAESSYWIDGKRIYSATDLGMRMVPAGEERVGAQSDLPRLELGSVRDYWRRHFNVGRWPAEDVFYGLAERFVRRVVVDDPEAFQAIHGRPALFLANHQVGVESLLFLILAGGFAGLPVVGLAKDAHRTTWLGRLVDLSFSYPGVADPGLIAFFNRDDAASLPRILKRLGERMARGERSVLVHVEGTRSLSCREGVKELSGTLLDLALQVGVPVVPVRFAGGLPVEPLAERLEFPVGFARQDYWLGRPLLPEELASLSYGERRAAVIDAINSLGPPNAEEEPRPPDVEFAAEVEAWIERTGASPEHAVIYKTLEKLAEPSPEVRQLVAGVPLGGSRGEDTAETGHLDVAEDDAGRWLAELARRLYGERGPRVVEDQTASRTRSGVSTASGVGRFAAE